MKIFNTSSLNETKLIKFFITSILVTATDYLVFFSMLGLLGPAASNIMAYCLAILLSFYLHKRFVFNINRKTPLVFFYIILFSLIAVAT